jgi:molybdopterin converting factor small subunit
MPVFLLPAALSKRVGKHSLDYYEEGVLDYFLKLMCSECPGIEPQVFAGSELTPFIKIFINSVDCAKLQGLQTPLKLKDEVQVILATAGG